MVVLSSRDLAAHAACSEVAYITEGTCYKPVDGFQQGPTTCLSRRVPMHVHRRCAQLGMSASGCSSSLLLQYAD